MKLRTAIATATTAAVLATSGVAIAGAATNPSSPAVTKSVTTAKPKPPAAESPAITRARLRALIRKGATAVITKTIGIDATTLRADLLAGQTIAQIAGTKGVSADAVIAALVTAATNKLNALVKAGKIKSDRATKLEAKLPAAAATLVNTWHPKKAKTTAS